MPTALLLVLASLPGVSRASPVSAELDYALKPADITKICTDAVERARTQISDISISPAGSRTFVNAFRDFDFIQDDLATEVAAPTFLKDVSTDRAVREAGEACEKLVDKFSVDVYSREDLYQALKDGAARSPGLSGEDKRLVEKTLLQFKRNGLELPPIERARVKILKKELVDLEADFSQNLDEIRDAQAFGAAELAGLPDDFLRRLERTSDGRALVTLDYPDYFPFMKNASRPDARRRLESRFQNRGFPDNVALLEEAISLRRRIAALLGYPSYAAYALEDRMAKNPKTVRAFLSRLRRKLDRKAGPELKVLEALKRKETGSAAPLQAWDYLYYDNMLKKEKYAIDDEKVKEYFPLGTVTTGLFDVYQTLLGLRFKELTPADAWHPDVRLFEVRDSSTSELMGYFYMDLFPRDGKYKHAASFMLIGERLGEDGTRRPPVAAIVANFGKPTADAPSLLKHSEVVTYFHEFGHIMHQVLSRAKYPRFAGTRVEQDFVEAPSQMLENWVWNAQILSKLSGHFKDPSRKLPPDLLARMVAAKNMDSGLRYLRQVFFATLDLDYHSARGPVDTTELYARLEPEIMLIPMSPGTHPQAGFGHLMGGYDSAYYGYLWSEVYSADMFARFEKEGVLDPRLGLLYRRLILEPGGGRDEGEGLRAFLGREPTEDAFLKSIGLEDGASASR